MLTVPFAIKTGLIKCPVPNPNYPAPAADESKDAFIDRCIAELMKAKQ